MDIQQSSPLQDNPAVLGRPPLLYAATFGVALVLRWIWPAPIFANAIGLWLGLTLLLSGVAIVIAGRRALQAAGTNVNPALPTTTIVSAGPYGISRNPLYLALTLIYLGLALAVDTWWGIGLLMPLLVVIHRGVVLREERYLESKFGETYRLYRSRVPRYL